jgi:hypothetical protein
LSAAALVLGLAACGVLPRPFAGHPGATAERLARPPPPRLAVPPPADALLPDSAAQAYADAVADQLQAREVPAVAGPAHKGDWVLNLTAELHGGSVVPGFGVNDPAGKSRGTGQVSPMPASSWSAAQPDTIKQAAAVAAPQIATLLTSIEAEVQESDPNSLRNRPPRLALVPVKGAPGDGNVSLTANMRRLLPEIGLTLVPQPEAADFVVTGTVHTAPRPGGTLQVEVQWVIKDAQGHDLGHVVQLNDVPAGSLSGYWGDVALVVAQQAAPGVQEIVAKQLQAGAPGKPATPVSAPAPP